MRALGPLLPQLTRRLRVYAESGPGEELMRANGLGPRHGTALGLLVFHDVTVGDMARELRLSLPTVSGVVADLDRAGIVQRSPDPEDRRRTIVALRAERREQVEAWLTGATTPILDVLEQLTGAERAAWIKATDLLVSRLDAKPS